MTLLSVANLTRQDGIDFLSQVPTMDLQVKTTTYRMEEANTALADLRGGGDVFHAGFVEALGSKEPGRHVQNLLGLLDRPDAHG